MSARRGARNASAALQMRGVAGGERGFTLAELAVALVVFMVGALTLALVMPLATRRAESAAIQSRASELAAQRAEMILVTPYGEDDLTAGTHNDPANPREGRYYVHWDVEVDQPYTACKRVTIGVSRNSVNAPAVAQLVIVVPQAGEISP